jgi:hypothetical protein
LSLKLRIDPIETVTEASIRADLSRMEQSRAAGAFVAEGIAAADAQNQRVLGRVPPKTVTVDGRLGAALESVNPDGGTIIVEYELIGDVLRWIGKTLVDRSPSVSGNYKRGHTLFVDGQEVPLNGQIPQGEEYAFTNMVPYARKIEIGKTESGRDFVIQVQNRIYERTARDARAKFGNIAQISFSYRGIVGGTQVNPMNARRASAGRHGRAAHNKSDLRFPTIYLRYRTS